LLCLQTQSWRIIGSYLLSRFAIFWQSGFAWGTDVRDSQA
jgi:cellobiose phosphorylase